MSKLSVAGQHAFTVITAVALIAIGGDVQAQNAPIQIGGPNGIMMGGGMGFKVGGKNGIHFGGGQGAKFGPTEFGMHFGNGQGARFGGQDVGMQFGGGQGARFGTSDFGMQFGNGEGARFGSKENPIAQFGGEQESAIGRPNVEPQFDQQPVQPESKILRSVVEFPANNSTPTIGTNLPKPNPASTHEKETFSVLVR